MITVFGSINLDLLATVHRLPRPGETVSGTGFATAPGGKGANQALAVARAGSSVRMVGAIGHDGFAQEALTLLRQGSVDLSALRTADAPTGIAVILVDMAGENVIAVIPGANAALTPRDGEALRFDPNDVLLLQMEIPVPAMIAAIDNARQAGAAVILNGAPYTSGVVKLAGAATHVVLNEHEFALLAADCGIPAESVEAGLGALARSLEAVVVVTLGPRGAIACDGDAVMRADAIPVHAVDTVGAGDTFCGYLAAGIERRMPLRDALRTAAAAGSLACTKPGAQTAIPALAEVVGSLSPK